MVVELITFEQLAEDYRERGMPEAVIPMSVGMEQKIATGELGPVTTAVADLTGTPPMGFIEFVKQALK